MGIIDDEILSDEEKKNKFMEMLNNLSKLNQMKEEKDKEDEILNHMSMTLASMQKAWFDAYVAVGFSEGQALDLTKNMINILLGSVRPLGDK